MNEDNNDGSSTLIGLGFLVGGALVTRAIYKKIKSIGNTQKTQELEERTESIPLEEPKEILYEESLTICSSCGKKYLWEEGYVGGHEYCSESCYDDDWASRE